MANKNELFQQLKPTCVALSQIALTLGRPPASRKDVIECFQALLKTLQSSVKTSHLLDVKLADYVFFPLSQVLRYRQQVSQRALELALRCLQILISHGWRDQLSPELAVQLLILLTFVAGGDPTAGAHPAAERSEELRHAAYDCLAALLSCCSRTSGAAALTATKTVPAIGHCVTVLLDGVVSGPSTAVQLSALAALDAFQDCVRDRDLLASFLPGTTSSLTKVLRQDSQSRRSWRLLEASLHLLSKVLQAVLSDVHVERLLASSDASGKEGSSSDASGKEVASGPTLNKAWLKATAGQVKLALASVAKLQDHDRDERSLAECTTLLVETVIGISSEDSTRTQSEGEKALELLALTDVAVADAIQSSLHAWVATLPRVIQSNDDRAKGRIIHQILTASRILSTSGYDPGLMGVQLADSLRDSATAIAKTPGIQRNMVSPSEDGLLSAPDLVSLKPTSGMERSFPPVLVAQASQQATLSQLQLLLNQLSESAWAEEIARSLLDQLHATANDEQLAIFWLSINMLKHASASTRVDSLLESYAVLESSSPDFWPDVLEELYAFSLSVLQSHPWKQRDPVADSGSGSGGGGRDGWRLQCLALETVSLQAQHLGSGFQPELIEVLYPVMHTLSSSTSPFDRQPHLAPLQYHAMLCLDRIAVACHYRSAGACIIENVDYLVNAIALKLNTFDLSPQAPRVLLMMIQLAGPSLLPFLDDVVDSIFVALENFHGYPRLVELLFAVLRQMVAVGGAVAGDDEGALRMGPGAKEIDHRKRSWRPRTMAEVARLLEEERRKKQQQQQQQQQRDHLRGLDDQENRESFPQRPWKSSPAPDTAGPDSPEAAAGLDDEEQAHTASTTTTGAPADSLSKTHTLLLRIARLTQHYLTHASPSLRLSLLQLITSTTTTLPSPSPSPSSSSTIALLPQHEDTFLPLINDLWPLIVSRLLHDPEPYVAVAAANCIAGLCRAAGDFMASRVETELWTGLLALYRRVAPPDHASRARPASDHRSAGALLLLNNNKNVRALAAGADDDDTPLARRYEATQTKVLHRALAHLLLVIVAHVRVSEEMFDELLELPGFLFAGAAASSSLVTSSPIAGSVAPTSVISNANDDDDDDVVDVVDDGRKTTPRRTMKSKKILPHHHDGDDDDDHEAGRARSSAHAHLQRVLESRNPDAVWLALCIRKRAADVVPRSTSTSTPTPMTAAPSPGRRLPPRPLHGTKEVEHNHDHDHDEEGAEAELYPVLQGWRFARLSD
ncbi:MAG: hypothetical protein M1826_007204 [Phylliscum demangeonii]|nr:MAG: hypothetical protein M1826_007204 [Phylliscum demangeonii]